MMGAWDKFKRFFVLFRKLLQNPGRLVFTRGSMEIDPAREAMPDSFTPEYYYLLQQKARLKLVGGINRYRKASLLKLPLFLVHCAVHYVHLRMVNALVASYLNESKLAERIAHGQAEPDRHP